MLSTVDRRCCKNYVNVQKCLEAWNGEQFSNQSHDIYQVLAFYYCLNKKMCLSKIFTLVRSNSFHSINNDYKKSIFFSGTVITVLHKLIHCIVW